MRSLSCFYKSLFLTHTCSMLSRQLHTALAILVIGCCHCALSLPFSKSPRGLSPANSTLSERITSIFDERPHQSRLPLSQYAIASLGLAEAAALSQAAYCKSVRRLYWTCGTACSKYPDIYVQWTAGTSEKVPFTYVARSKSLQAVVVAHAGTNFYSLDSWLADADVDLIPVDKRLNKLDTDDDNSRILVHAGFYEVWQSLYPAIYEQVKMALNATGYTTVLVVGHSQGAAVAQIEAMALRMDLKKRINVENIGFGCPRLGNKQWADFVGRVLGNSQVHVVHYDDAVPQVPPAWLTDYNHAKNEIWIDDDNKKTYLCRGQENDECSKSIDLPGVSAHSGPYFGIKITADNCDNTD